MIKNKLLFSIHSQLHAVQCEEFKYRGKSFCDNHLVQSHSLWWFLKTPGTQVAVQILCVEKKISIVMIIYQLLLFSALSSALLSLLSSFFPSVVLVSITSTLSTCSTVLENKNKTSASDAVQSSNYFPTKWPFF